MISRVRVQPRRASAVFSQINRQYNRQYSDGFSVVENVSH